MNRQSGREPKVRGGSEAGRKLPDPLERKSGSGKAMAGKQLWEAAHDGDAAKVKTLLSTKGAQSFINYQDSHGATAIHIAAHKGHDAVTKLLLAARCNVDLQAENGATPLHIATQQRNEVVSKQLIEARCNVDLQANDGATPLHYAADKGHEAVTKQLIAARCNLDLQTEDGWTALNLATYGGQPTRGHVAVTEQLLAARCNVDAQAKDGGSSIFCAAQQGYEAVVDQLIAARCNVDLHMDIDGSTPLHAAVDKGHVAVSKQLIAARCNVDLQAKTGFTPLHVAALQGHEAISNQLIVARCNVNLQDKDACTALHFAAEKGHAPVAKQLLAVRCNVDLEGKFGRTALQLAEHHGHAGVATLLRKKRQETPLLGGRVVINGLVAKPELNGRAGTAVSFDDDKGRYSVELDESSSFMIGGAFLNPMIKPFNLLPTVCSVRNTKREREEEERRRKEIRRQREEEARQRRDEEEQQKEETDFCRVWREVIELLEKTKGNEIKSAFGLGRPWMQEIKENLFDFSKMEEDAESLAGVLAAQQHVLSTDFAASQDNSPSPDGGGGGALEGDAACEVHVEKNMKQESVDEEDSLPGDMSEEQWLRANSDNESDNWALWYTEEVRKWYKHAV